ncbi:MAG TPA: proton-conducting transporter membrane subunit [Intrasporangium sp.]|uniref:NADH-quinone oxidoreductase subunit N n=1 Tax=Intrasporangium sp. TaxID=1925024 RepID=UPI002D777A51|nr:proton-conducting transporter membrane subunit [Intrasporangium sp.]HET7398797.1 proton-conducting transporter membrane subunit [Intrasporangium sp.]
MTGLTFDVVPLLPALLPILGVVGVLLADLVTPTLRRGPYAVAAAAALGAAVAAAPGTRMPAGSARSTLCMDDGLATTLERVSTPRCFWTADSLTSTLQLAACLAAVVCIALAWPRASAPGAPPGHAREPVEATLLLTALSGTVVVAASRDVGTWLVALELATLPIVVLVALGGSRAAVAGAVQLLVTSLVSFALLTLGVALWFLATGSPFLTADAAGAVAGAGPGDTARPLLSLAVVIILAGLGFKLSLAPFHAWTPTAYAGSRTAVATFLATVSKVAALAGLLVVLRAVAVLGTPGLLAVGVLAVLSMTLGNVVALRQDDVVRLLAWSTVAQAGWVVLPLVSVSGLGVRASAGYLLTYVVATLVAFAVVAGTVREVGPQGRRLGAYAALWQRRPWQAAALALALTSLAGLPPGVVGLVGKVVALRPVVAQDWLWLAVLAAANAVLGVAVYLRWLRPVLTSAGADGPRTGGDPGTPDPEAPPRERPVAVTVALLATTAVLVAVSVQPDLLLGPLGR